MSKWKEKKLGDILKIKHGYAFKGESITNIENKNILVTPGNFNIGGGFNYYGKKFYNGEIPIEYILKSDDIIVTMTDLSKEGDTLGYAALVPNDKRIYLHNQRIGLIYDIDREINRKFLYWILRTPWYQKRIVNTSNGANVKHTSPNRIYAYTTKIPDLHTQERIADILSTYDDLIENNNRRIELLEKVAQELYKEWFVRFRFPNHENTKFLNGLPVGWEVKRLQSISDFIYGKMPDKSKMCDNGYPIFSGYRINGFYPEYMFEDEMLILIARGVGGTGEVKLSPAQSYITNLSIIFKLKDSIYKLYLLQLFLLTNLRYLDTGAAQSQITIENLKKVKVVIPDSVLLEKFNSITIKTNDSIKLLQKQNLNLKKQRDLLLPRLMSGKLEV